MKLPTFFYYKHDNHSEDKLGIGVEWFLCREGPSRSFPKPDTNYYDYLVLSFKFVRYSLQIDIFYKRMPYRNYEQYIQFIKANRKK